ncbi:MAG: DNA/pantothenate metabolism flavoprotein domain protein, partial [Verrucomicrobia bacterium]|nr:DNA/pantothenate metabolism flavoprotein domain protein [Verrucomicrobiota bacterium]
GGKVDSRGGPLWAHLIPTPKILPQLREWFPRGWITGWKYEVDGLESDAVARGVAQMSGAGSDACVVNGPACGTDWIWLRQNQAAGRFESRAALLQALVDAVPR